MMHPSVAELAVEGVPVTVTWRVLKMARPTCYRWLDAPVFNRAWVQAHQLIALVVPAALGDSVTKSAH